MIVCKKCDDVLYTNTMPEGTGEIVYVLCEMCARAYTMTITITEEIRLV
jgi:hypothetical protein